MTDNKKQYIAFCERDLDVPIFSQPWYLDIVCGESNWDVLIVRKGREIAATMPLLKKKQFGFLLSRMPLLTPYLGPYFSKNFRPIKQQEKMMRALIQQFPKIDLFDQKFHPSMTNCLPFYWEGFEATVRYSFLIDLNKGLEKIYQNISRNYRNNRIKKAEKIVKISITIDLEKFYSILQKTFERQKLAVPFSLDFFEKFDSVLIERKSRCIFFATDEKNQIHATLYLAWDKETAYFLMAGNDPNFGSSGAGIYITWHGIKYAKEVLGKKRFDFMGSVIENIARVRQEFGAEQISYFNVKRFGSKFLEVLYKVK